MSHTPEPWAKPYYSTEEGDCGWWVHNGKVGAEEYAIFVTFSLNPNQEADARRIVACVNACKGMPQDWLESGMPGCIQNIRDERDMYKQQRDSLLAAGKALVDRWDTPGWKDAPHTGEFIAKLRAAIAAIESNLTCFSCRWSFASTSGDLRCWPNNKRDHEQIAGIVCLKYQKKYGEIETPKEQPE